MGTDRMSDLPARRPPIHVNVNLGRGPEEVVYFDRGGVTVTSDRVVCHSSTYPVRGITKVEAEEEVTGGGRWLMMTLVCVPPVGIAAIFIVRDHWPSGIGLIVASVAAAVLVLLLRKPRTRYHVLVHTAGGQGEVISTPDEQVADEIAGAIDAAVVNYRP